MAFFTERELRAYAARPRHTSFSNIKEARASAKATIFLSHSHKDKELVIGLIRYLDTVGVSVYVDWNDTEMPRITNRTTADKIKTQIENNALFMVFATKHALASKWVPWEIGVADQKKGADRVIIIPVQDDSGQFSGSEYLQLYQRVSSNDAGDYGVFAPNKSEGLLLESVMNKYASTM